ncbi:MAG TPA: hypothetical protein VLE74_02645 [Candidatus Saccharimonadales bacterium]|nr:hypothetical protein [Candidatus Saccharimonadales bacterium]
MSDQDLLEQEENTGQHDDLGVHPERREAETAELNKLYDDSPDDNNEFNFHGEGGGRKTPIKARLQSAFAGKKGRRRLIAGSILGGGSIMFLFLLIFFISTLTIPNFMEHVTAYQFARTTRQFANSAGEIEGEKIMLDTASDTAYSGFIDRYSGGRVSAIRDKVNSYRPEKVVDNLETKGRLTYVYEDGATVAGFTRQRLTAILLDGQEISASNPTLVGRLLHPIKTFTDKIDYRSDLKDGLEVSLNGRNTLVRSSVAKAIRGRVDAKLVRWVRNGKPDDPKNPDNYEKDAKTAEQLNAEESYAVATDDGKAPRLAAGDTVTKAVEEGQTALLDAEEICLKDPACYEDQAATGKPFSQKALTALDTALQSDTLDKLASTFSTAGAVAIPLCLIYDGSVNNSKNTIDAQNDSNIRTFNSVAAVNGHQQSGQNISAPALNALIHQLNGKDGIGASVPELRANNRPVDTTEFASAQASSSQSFTLLDAIPGIPQVAINFMNNFADKFCPTLTNTYVILGLGAGEILIVAGTGGSVSLTDAGLKEFVTVALKDFFDEFSAKTFVTDLVKTGAKIGAATELAKLIVASRAGSVHNGLARGKPITSDIDAGGNAMASYEEQQMLAGAPMNNADTAFSMLEDHQYLAHQQSRLPITQRYFALSNPDSLLTKVGTVAASYLNFTALSKTLGGLGHILDPLSSFAAIFSHWGTGTAVADSVVDKANYGQVQFGWTPNEEAKIASDASYQHPLENQRILDGSGKEDEIANKYKDCFEKTIGQLLSDKEIQRDTNGNVIDSGLCSPKNLSYNNPDYGDLVFRWRIAIRHQKTLDHLLDIQNVQSSQSAANTSTGPASTTQSGSPTASPACTEPTAFPSTAQAGGMTYVNWSFGSSDINNLQHEIDILNDPGTSSHEFLQLYDAKIDNTGQYYGLQTTGTAIFSRFGTTDKSNVVTGPGSTVTAGTNEGPFVSLRHDFGSLPAGHYSTRMVRAKFDGAGDWFDYFVTFPGKSESYIGSIRFPRANPGTPASFQNGGSSWTEFWDNNDIGGPLQAVPTWHVVVTVKAGGATPVSATSRYSVMPNSDVFADSADAVHQVIGGSTARCHPAGSLWNVSTGVKP